MSYYTRSLLDATATESFKSSVKISPSTTTIGGVFSITEKDSIDGMWFFFGGLQQGVTKLVVKVEAAVVPHQTTWVEVGEVEFGAGLVTEEASQATLLLQPTAGEILPPYLRFKFVAAAGCSAKFTDIFKSSRG